MLEIIGLSKAMGSHKAIENLNLTANPAEIICVQSKSILGRTFCELLVGLQRQDAGSISIDTYDMVYEPESAKRLIGYLPENNMEYLGINGREFLYLSGYLYYGYGLESPEKCQIRILELVPADLFGGLDDWLNKKIRVYSNEMKKVLWLIAALLHNPKVLVLDQPFSNLSSDILDLFIEQIKDYTSKQGIVVFTAGKEIDQQKKLSEIFTRVIDLEGKL